MMRRPHPLMEAVGAVVTWTSDIVPGLSIIEVPRGGTEIAESVMRVMREAEYVERDAFGRGLSAPNDPDYATFQKPYFDLVCASGGWNVRTTATKPVSVLGSGVTYWKLDLKDNMLVDLAEANGQAGVDDDGNSFIDDVWGTEFLYPGAPPGTWPNPLDQEGHETGVASVVGAAANNGLDIAGVAWKCKLLPVKCQDRFGVGTYSTMIQAMEYSWKRGVRIVNVSFPFYSNDSTAARQVVQNTPDTLYVFSAGNSSVDLDDPCSDNLFPQEWPYSNIICVGGCTANDQPWWIPPPNPCNWWEGSTCLGATTVDLFAPAVSIRALQKDNDPPTLVTGTSYAAPIVAGTAALVWSEHPTYSVQDVKNKILNSGDSKPQYAGLCVTGKRLNIAAALDSSSCQ